MFKSAKKPTKGSSNRSYKESPKGFSKRPSRGPNKFANSSKTSWGGVSHWYSDLVGESGHYYHQHLILPKLLKLLNLKPEDSLLDMACGEGVVERAISPEQKYLGVDIADGLLKQARQKAKSAQHRFMLGNLAKPITLPEQYSKAVCVLALQNMMDGKQCIQNASKALKKDARFIIVLNHPCFRIPRQTSWETDQKNKLQYRRINRYFSDLEIPIQMSPGKKQGQVTWSYHHPLSTYFSWLKQNGFIVEDCQEWVSDKESQGKAAKMENRARTEIPLFLCLVAKKI